MSEYKPKEYCGLMGVYNHPESVKLTYLGMYSLQHRGQESAGIAFRKDNEILCHRGMGLVGEVFADEVLDSLSGDTAIGHVRYSTTGSSLF